MSKGQLHPCYGEGVLQLPGQETPLQSLSSTPLPHYVSATRLVCCFFYDILGHNCHPVLTMSTCVSLLSETGIDIKYFMGYSVVLFLLGQHKGHKGL